MCRSEAESDDLEWSQLEHRLVRRPVSDQCAGGRERAFQQVGLGDRRYGERGPQPGMGAAAVGLVQPHDHVTTTVLSELDRLDDDRLVVHRDERRDRACAFDLP